MENKVESEAKGGLEVGRPALQHAERKRSGKRQKVDAESKQAFRVTYKRMAITYPQCKADLSTFKEHFLKKLDATGLGSVRLSMVQEPHADGGIHYHVALTTMKKPDIKNPRYFDLTIDGVVYHPNIKKMYSDYFEQVYMMAGNDMSKYWIQEDRPYIPQMFQMGTREKVYKDIEFTKNFNNNRSKKPVNWPVELKFLKEDSVLIPEPDGNVKKRHYWIYGPPDAGKSYAVEHAFQDNAIYCVPEGNGQFDKYLQQQVIFYDDVYPKMRQLLNICNCSLLDRYVGDTRNVHVTLQANQARLVIVCVNASIKDVYSKCSETEIAAVYARFYEIELK